MVQRVLAREARGAAPSGDDALLARALGLAEAYLPPGAPQPRASPGCAISISAGVRVRRARERSGSPIACRPCPAGWSTTSCSTSWLTWSRPRTHARSGHWWLATRKAERARGYLEGYLAGHSRAGGVRRRSKPASMTDSRLAVVLAAGRGRTAPGHPGWAVRRRLPRRHLRGAGRPGGDRVGHRRSARVRGAALAGFGAGPGARRCAGWRSGPDGRFDHRRGGAGRRARTCRNW